MYNRLDYSKQRIIVISIIQNICNRKMDKTNEKVINSLHKWNKTEKDDKKNQKRITK